MSRNKNNILAWHEQLKTLLPGRDVYYFDEATSTNAVAKTYADMARPGSVVIASRQTEGRGRLDRIWESPKDIGLYMTLIYRPNMLPQNMGCVPLTAAIAVAQAVENQGIRVKVKWPNDVMLNGKKFCGILCEISTGSLLIGIGTNIDNSRQSLDDCGLINATSIALESDAFFDKVRYAADICMLMDGFIRQLENDAFLLNTYKNYCITLHHEVKIIEKGIEERDRETVAFAFDINNDGSLRVHLADGSIRDVYAGDVSIRS